MKLRLRNNSIRLRLTQTEVAQFRATGQVEETIDFGPDSGPQLKYSLIAADVEQITADIEGGKITVAIPRKDALEWSGSDRVGLEMDQSVGEGKILRILVEKDFACLEPRTGEEDTDAFPHPLAQTACES